MFPELFQVADHKLVLRKILDNKSYKSNSEKLSQKLSKISRLTRSEKGGETKICVISFMNDPKAKIYTSECLFVQNRISLRQMGAFNEGVA